MLSDYASKYPDKAYLYSIGKSAQGRELWVMALSNSMAQMHHVGRPEGKLWLTTMLEMSECMRSVV